MKPQEFLDSTRCGSATARTMFELLCRTRGAITEVGKLPIPEAQPVRAYLVQRAKQQTEAYKSHLQQSGVELPVSVEFPVDPHGYDDLTVDWSSDEDPPHLVQIHSADSRVPARPARAREVVEHLGYHVPLLADGKPKEGLYKTLIPPTFPNSKTVTLGDAEWTVSVIYR